MACHRSILSLFLALLVVSASVTVFPFQPSGTAEGATVEELSDELNETREKLAKAEKDRDTYAVELEEQTILLFIVFVLLVVSYIIFYVANRRMKVLFLELQRQTGVTLTSPQQKRRPRRRKG
jgi:hypothetical protein